MAASQTKSPVLVIVPGSFAPPTLYHPFITHLTSPAIGFPDVRVITTPTVGRRPGQTVAATMSDDAAAIVSFVQPILDDEDRDVILMPHSYGGVPTSQAMEKLSRKNRPEGKRAVEKVAYCTAVVLPEGASNMAMSGGALPDWVKIDGDFMEITDTSISGPLTFSDLPDEEAIKLSSGMTIHSKPSFEEKLTYPGYNDVEVHYILCGKDKIIAAEHQQAMIGMIEQSSGKKVNVHRIECDHCPMYSQRDELTQILKSIVLG